jgi:DNA mismatch repair ATPase MutS
MKAMAINLLFSQTIGICLARKAIMPPARLKTMIVRKDAIIGGRSHFFSEAIELRHMLQEAEQAKRDYWFIIDEIFRGTNSIERVAAGGALLNYLTRRSLVFASTHDLELSNLLRHEFDSFYFSEVIVGEDARFDYLIKKGTCQSRNAIKLMILAGYPKEVIDEANRFVAQMEK